MNSSHKCMEWLTLLFLNNERHHNDQLLAQHLFLIKYQLTMAHHIKCAKFLYLELYCLFFTAENVSFLTFIKLLIDDLL